MKGPRPKKFNLQLKGTNQTYYLPKSGILHFNFFSFKKKRDKKKKKKEIFPFLSHNFHQDIWQMNIKKKFSGTSNIKIVIKPLKHWC